MPEAIGKVIASYITTLKYIAPLTAKTEPLERLSRREPAALKSVEVSTSKEAMDCNREE